LQWLAALRFICNGKHLGRTPGINAPGWCAIVAFRTTMVHNTPGKRPDFYKKQRLVIRTILARILQ
jgi:hypothetical protein